MAALVSIVSKHGNNLIEASVAKVGMAYVVYITVSVYYYTSKELKNKSVLSYTVNIVMQSLLATM